MQQKVFRIVRDSRPLEEKLREGFVYTERDITSINFSAATPAGPNPPESVLVNFGEYVFSEGVLSRFEQMGLRPGLPTELVDLSKSLHESTDLATCLPLVALGDSWQGPLGNLLVVFLVGDAKGRGLSLHWRGGGWNDSYWFIAFHV